MVPNQPTAKEFASMAEEGRIAIIKAEKVSFWKQYERGMLSSEAVQILVSLADKCLDEKDRFLKPYVKSTYGQLRSITNQIIRIDNDSRPSPHNPIFLQLVID